MNNLKINNDEFIEIKNNCGLQVLKGAVIGSVFIVIISFLPALLIKCSVFSTSNIKVFSNITLFIGCLIGSCFSALIHGKNGMFVGVLTGLLILLFIILTGLLFQTISFEMIDLSLFLVKLFGLMLFGAIGGIIGINLKS